MARIRTIKNDFFFHEEMAQRSPLARLLFIGLWTLADREGRLEDRPKRIEAQVLPWEDCDVDELLEELAEGGFIVRYVAHGRRCIAIPSFSRHQRPHPKEAESELPGPEEAENEPSREKVRLCREKPGSFPSSPAGKGREGVLDNGKGREGVYEAAADAASAPLLVVEEISDDEPTEKPGELQKLWNDGAHPSLPRCREMTPKRVKAARQRLRERPLVEFLRVIEKINASAFCCGDNPRGWRAHFDWLLQADTATKVLEGQYDNTGERLPPKRATPRPEPPCEACGKSEGYRGKFWGHWLCGACGAEANEGGSAASVDAWLSQQQQNGDTACHSGETPR